MAGSFFWINLSIVILAAGDRLAYCLPLSPATFFRNKVIACLRALFISTALSAMRNFLMRRRFFIRGANRFIVRARLTLCWKVITASSSSSSSTSSISTVSAHKSQSKSSCSSLMLIADLRSVYNLPAICLDSLDGTPCIKVCWSPAATAARILDADIPATPSASGSLAPADTTVIFWKV